MNVETCTLYFAGTARGPEKDRMSTQAYYKERLGFDPADTVAEHQREQRSQHGYEESLSKFKGQNANGFPGESPGCNGVVGEHRAGNTQAFWGCWAMFIEAHGRWKEEQLACGCWRIFEARPVFPPPRSFPGLIFPPFLCAPEFSLFYYLHRFLEFSHFDRQGGTLLSSDYLLFLYKYTRDDLSLFRAK